MRIPTRMMAVAGAAAVLVMAWSAPAEEAARLGRVVQLSGPVTILRAGDASSAAVGSAILTGDRVITGRRSRVRITLFDRTSLVLGADSDVEISTYLRAGAAEESGLMSLLRGILRLTGPAGGAERGTRVRTRAAIASVRSTDWIVEADFDTAAVLVVRGRVDVAAALGGGRITLRTGEGSDIRRGSAPGSPVPWGAARAEDALARTSLP